MQRSRLILVSLLVASLVQPALAQFEIGPESTRVPEGGARVALHMDRPIPIIRASINGEGPFPFFLDTGAAGIVLNEAFAQEMGMEVVGTQQVRDMASGVDIDSDQVRIAQVEIGGAVFSGLDALLIDRSEMFGTSDEAPRGIIGRSTFADCLLTVDYPRGEVRIEEGQLPPANGRSILAYEFSEGSTTPEFTVDVEGTRYATHIDTGGSSGITLPFDQMDSLPLDGKPAVIGQARGAGGSFEVYGSRLKGTIKLGAYAWESPQVTFVPNIQWVHLGTDVLKRFAISWDQRNRRARFDDPKGVGTDRTQTQRPKRYGIRMNPGQIGSGPLVVEGVIKGMAAEACGLRAGDRIIALDGKSVTGMSQLDLATLFRRPRLTVTIERDGKTTDLAMRLD